MSRAFHPITEKVVHALASPFAMWAAIASRLIGFIPIRRLGTMPYWLVEQWYWHKQFLEQKNPERNDYMKSLMQLWAVCLELLTRSQKSSISAPMKIQNHMLSDPKVDTSIQSPNVSSGTIKPEIIVLHYTASGGEDGEGDASYLSRASSRASAHVVTGRNGSIHQIVPFNRRAWHAGSSNYNGRKNVNAFSIGIEIDNWGWLKNGKTHAGTTVPSDHIFHGDRNGLSHWETYKVPQLEATEEVIAAICAEYDIKDIVGHEDVAPGRKQDPGPALDEFMAKMKEKYVNEVAVSSPTPTPTKKAPAEGTAKVTTNGLRLRERASYTSKILTHLYVGYNVQVLDHNIYPGWDKVKYKNKVGFVANQYLDN